MVTNKTSNIIGSVNLAQSRLETEHPVTKTELLSPFFSGDRDAWDRQDLIRPMTPLAKQAQPQYSQVSHCPMKPFKAETKTKLDLEQCKIKMNI